TSQPFLATSPLRISTSPSHPRHPDTFPPTLRSMSAIVDIPTSLQPLQRFVGDALTRVERRFDAQLRSDLLPVRRLCQHVERYRGKMLRPMLVVLAGLATDGAYAGGAGGVSANAGGAPDDADIDISEDHISLAAVCEMIHMATLVHDDVLDEADTR